MQSHPHYPDTLVAADQIGRLVSGGARLVEVDLDPDAYEQGHLPGAIPWSWGKQLRNPETQEILNLDEFEALMGASGMTPDTPIIVYGDNNNWFACWAFWLLRLYGHANVRLLDGGVLMLIVQGLPLSSEMPTFGRTCYVAAKARSEDRASTEEVFAAIFEPEDYCLLDVRSSAEFEGRIKSPGVGKAATCGRAGHIPNSITIPWNLNCNGDGTFKSPDELRKLYAESGVIPEKSVITYCAIGERASLTWFVLKQLLGYPVVMNYDRSMAHWSHLENAPIENAPVYGSAA